MKKVMGIFLFILGLGCVAELCGMQERESDKFLQKGQVVKLLIFYQGWTREDKLGYMKNHLLNQLFIAKA